MNSLIKCPFCNRWIKTENIICIHCGKNILYGDSQKIVDKKTNDIGIFSVICFWLVAITLFCSFFYDVYFRLTHLTPKINSIISDPIDISQNTIQKNLNGTQHINKIVKNKTQKIILQAEYSISGMVVAKNTNFGIRGIFRNNFDNIALFDFGLVWGDIANKELIRKYFKIKSQKTLGEARQLSYSWRDDKLKYSPQYITSHISHNHIIPANDNIISALFKIKKWDKVKLDGYLVDIIFSDGQKDFTSLSRLDDNYSSRGSGACEIFYVTGIQLDDKYYK